MPLVAAAAAIAPAALAEVLAHPALRRLCAGASCPSPLAAPAAAPQAAPVAAPAWSRAELSGRLCELGPGREPAVLTAAMALVRDAQRAGEPAVWISLGNDLFYPPDAAAGGVDLAALPVVRARDLAAAGRAADLLLRSGAFGLVVVDLLAAGERAVLPVPLQSRLVQLARRHDAAVLCLRRAGPEAPSLGSLVSLRAAATRRRVGDGRYLCRVDVRKDKRRGPGWSWQGVWRGADGLC
ncbi:MAG: recombinase A [Candidatus Krumholzibacteria bacterium]|nr:recombinase A [Candidatus Krumholzibacteria bacterium]